MWDRIMSSPVNEASNIQAGSVEGSVEDSFPKGGGGSVM